MTIDGKFLIIEKNHGERTTPLYWKNFIRNNNVRTLVELAEKLRLEWNAIYRNGMENDYPNGVYVFEFPDNETIVRFALEWS